MHGNVFEWTQDCWNESYSGAPTTGSAWTGGDCSLRVVRGGSWIDDPQFLRSTNRDRIPTTDRNINIGFRVARTL
jgi:formylglycine-generating enzyme required for sulfatase activity